MKTQEINITVLDFNEQSDEFDVRIVYRDDEKSFAYTTMGAGAVAMLAGGFDTPDTFIGRSINLTVQGN